MGGLLRRLLGRRERVVPVVLGRTRRDWQRAAAHDWASRLHLRYLTDRDLVQPGYFARSGPYPMPGRGLPRLWRWFVCDVFIQALRLARRNGRPVRAVTGVSVLRQCWDLFRLSVTVPSMPENYYKFEWYRPEYRLRAAEYLHRHETKGALYELLARSADLEVTAPLNDKVDFARHVDRAGLAVVPTLATVSASGMRGQEGGLPAIDLFVKPRTGKGGRGAQRWRYVPGTDGYRCAGRPEVVARHQLARRLADDAAGQELLVQPCLVNHPELADLALDAVVTCRLITIADEVGEPEPVIAIFRMPATPAVVVDNMHRGGLAAPVDIAAGELGPASGYAAAGPATRHARHPVSGGMIVGRKLPLWTDVLGLAVRAHKAFQPRVLVGWDISIGPSGPVLVEGNEQPGVDGLQRLHNLPLGSHRFGQLLGFHLIAPE